MSLDIISNIDLAVFSISGQCELSVATRQTSAGLIPQICASIASSVVLNIYVHFVSASLINFERCRYQVCSVEKRIVETHRVEIGLQTLNFRVYNQFTI